MIHTLTDIAGWILLALSPFIAVVLFGQIGEWFGTKRPPQHYDRDDQHLPPGA